ncbi:MAG: hypothetical protein O7A09_14465 [Proteobacteria bacterium]|nr:hypothetical protein [Pseudomonadota bacterium]
MKGCDADKLARYAELGADRVILLGFAGNADQLRGTLETLGEQFVEPARSL